MNKKGVLGNTKFFWILSDDQILADQSKVPRSTASTADRKQSMQMALLATICDDHCEHRRSLLLPTITEITNDYQQSLFICEITKIS